MTVVVDPYQPQLWHDFFLAIAGAAAALAGLLFVAMSLHLRYIATEPVYRDTARGSLIGLVLALVLSLLVLLPQPAPWLAFETGFAALAYLAGFGAYQLITMRRGVRIPTESVLRSIGAYALTVVGLASALGQVFRLGPGLYVLAVIVVTIVVWSLWNAWVLVMGVADEEIAKGTPGL